MATTSVLDVESLHRGQTFDQEMVSRSFSKIDPNGTDQFIDSFVKGESPEPKRQLFDLADLQLSKAFTQISQNEKAVLRDEFFQRKKQGTLKLRRTPDRESIYNQTTTNR